MAQVHDLVVRGGTVIDGSGRPGFRADVAIDGGKIVAVGEVAGVGREELDATGLIVTPGFVDMHTHYDGQASWDPMLSPSSGHGVTTVVIGNCGVGFAPVRPDDRDWLIKTMEGVEDIPGSALSEGIQWAWESFPDYLDHLGQKSFAIDVGTQIPHAALRGYVLGRKAAEDGPSTAAEVAEMKRLVKEALEAGALGFSTSRTSLHKTSEGTLMAGTFAPVDELMGIGEAMKETGRGVFEIADEHGMVGQDITWMEELANRTGRPVIFNLSQIDFAPKLWREVLTKLEGAAARGAPLYAQSAGRAIGILMNWRLTAHPFVLHPSFVAIASLPFDEMIAQLRDPAVRERILSEDNPNPSVFEYYITRSFQKMFPLRDGGDYEPEQVASVASVAAATGKRPLEVAYDAMMRLDGEGFLYFPLFNYTDGDLAILHTLHQHPRVLMGLSDGGAHCGAICDGGMPTFMLSHWTRDRSRGPTLPLEWVIHRQTRQTAEFYGLLDRGLVAEGYRADLNLIAYDELGVGSPRVVYDLPAGGRRLMQDATGYRATICAGTVTFRDGQPTGALPGRLVRGPQAAPAP